MGTEQGCVLEFEKKLAHARTQHFLQEVGGEGMQQDFAGSAAGTLASLRTRASRDGRALLDVADVLERLGGVHSQASALPYWEPLSRSDFARAQAWREEGPPSSDGWVVSPEGGLLIAYLESASKRAGQDRVFDFAQQIQKAFPECEVLDPATLRKVAEDLQLLPLDRPAGGRKKRASTKTPLSSPSKDPPPKDTESSRDRGEGEGEGEGEGDGESASSCPAPLGVRPSGPSGPSTETPQGASPEVDMIVTNKADLKVCVKLGVLYELIGKRKKNMQTVSRSEDYYKRLKDSKLLCQADCVGGFKGFVGTPEAALLIVDCEERRGRTREGQAAAAREKLMRAFPDALEGLDLGKLASGLMIEREPAAEGAADEHDAPCGEQADGSAKTPGLIARGAVLGAPPPTARGLDFQDMGVDLEALTHAKAREGGSKDARNASPAFSRGGLSGGGGTAAFGMALLAGKGRGGRGARPSDQIEPKQKADPPPPPASSEPEPAPPSSLPPPSGDGGGAGKRKRGEGLEGEGSDPPRDGAMGDEEGGNPLPASVKRAKGADSAEVREERGAGGGGAGGVVASSGGQCAGAQDREALMHIWEEQIKMLRKQEELVRASASLEKAKGEGEEAFRQTLARQLARVKAQRELDAFMAT